MLDKTHATYIDPTPPEEAIKFNEEQSGAEEADVENEDSELEATAYGRVVRKPTQYEPSFKGKNYDVALMILARVFVQGVFDKKYQIGKDYPYKKAKKLFGKKASKSTFKEFEQIHMRGTLEPLNPDEMTEEQKAKALRSIVLTKMKDTGECKTRTVADGSQQRGTVDDEDKTSPTVSLLVIFLTCIIEARERRDVATLDIPNAFLHSMLPEDQQVIMKVTGELAEILAAENISP